MSTCCVAVETEESLLHPSGQVEITVGEWLVWRMRKQNVSNTKLWKRLRAKGYRCSKPFIANMRTNQSKIPLELIPLLLECLTISAPERQHWELQLLRAYLPEAVHSCLRNPFEEDKRRILAILSARKS